MPLRPYLRVQLSLFVLLIILPPLATVAKATALTTRGIDHVFEEYNGDHRNRMWGRSGRMAVEILPYFWMLLDHEVQCPKQKTSRR